MNFYNIPEEMKALRQWVCFRTYLDKETGKYKKVIISPVTGKYAQCNNPDTWTDFESAKKYCQKHRFNGLTFALQSGIVFIDIDHAIDKDTGNIISEEAATLLELLSGTFAERSVSGTGIHILFKGNLPENAVKRNDGKGLEMYDTKRFICMTGDLLSTGSVLQDYSDKAAEINYSFIGKREERTFIAFACQFSDTKLIEAISKSRQGEKFQRLFNGDIFGYASHSQADFALASILSWWTQDFDQIDRIFRSSGLMRDKYDRRTGHSTYGANLIQTALGLQPAHKSYRFSGYEM